MRANVLLVAPAPGGGRRDSRFGDLFDGAFIDSVRALHERSGRLTLLVPWTADLAPLIAAAILDLAPSFDPEGSFEPDRVVSGAVPYRPPGHAALQAAEDRLWRACYLSLRDEAPRSFEEALKEHPPTHVVALGTPSQPAKLRRVLRLSDPEVLLFGSLLTPDEAKRALGATPSRLIDLESLYEAPSMDSEAGSEAEAERAPEGGLEPYVSFGVLLQRRFDEWLSDDRAVRDGGTAPPEPR